MWFDPEEEKPYGQVVHSAVPRAEHSITHTDQEAGRAPDVLRMVGRITFAALEMVGKLVGKFDSPISGR